MGLNVSGILEKAPFGPTGSGKTGNLNTKNGPTGSGKSGPARGTDYVPPPINDQKPPSKIIELK